MWLHAGKTMGMLATDVDVPLTTLQEVICAWLPRWAAAAKTLLRLWLDYDYVAACTSPRDDAGAVLAELNGAPFSGMPDGKEFETDRRNRNPPTPMDVEQQVSRHSVHHRGVGVANRADCVRRVPGAGQRGEPRPGHRGCTFIVAAKASCLHFHRGTTKRPTHSFSARSGCSCEKAHVYQGTMVA